MRRYSMINLCPLRPRSYSRNTFSCFSALMQKFSVLPASAYFFLCNLKYTLIFVVFQYNILLIYKFLCAHKNVIYLLNINKKATRIFLRCYSKHGYCENNFPIQLFKLTLYFILTGFFGFSCFRFIFSSSYPFYYICRQKTRKVTTKNNFFYFLKAAPAAVKTFSKKQYAIDKRRNNRYNYCNYYTLKGG